MSLRVTSLKSMSLREGIYVIEAYYIWCKFFITFVVDNTFGVIFLLHLWLIVLSVSYYIWCNFVITFVFDITFGVIFLLHLRLVLHLV